jgi:hypothetical protein
MVARASRAPISGPRFRSGRAFRVRRRREDNGTGDEFNGRIVKAMRGPDLDRCRIIIRRAS